MDRSGNQAECRMGGGGGPRWIMDGKCVDRLGNSNKPVGDGAADTAVHLTPH